MKKQILIMLLTFSISAMAWNGPQNGWGTFTFPNGHSYEGEWVDGKIEGVYEVREDMCEVE